MKVNNTFLTIISVNEVDINTYLLSSSLADVDSTIASAIIVLPPLPGGVTEQLDVMSPQSLAVTRLPGQLILTASDSMESIQVFEQVLRTVFYTTNRPISYVIHIV